MKKIVILSFLFIASFSFGQRRLPIIKATKKNATIFEGDYKVNWGINPKISPDTHMIGKSPKPQWVRFYTDIDSIKVKLKPGEKFDFIVLLNGKDSCLTRLESPAPLNYSRQKPETHDTIPFTLTPNNNIIFKAVVNKKDTLNLMFDSGATGLVLIHSTLNKNPKAFDIENPVSSLRLGNLSWDKLRIYDAELSGQGTDGLFGWDLFDGKIVEIDFDKSLFIVHSNLFAISATYSKLPIEYINNYLCIQGDLQIKDKHYQDRFLFDSGYQRTIMLDTTMLAAQHYPKNLRVIKKVMMHNIKGGEVPVITVNNEKLNLGKVNLKDIPVQLMATANPTRVKTHILGNEVLKRFNTILDFQNNIIYLKPNSLIKLPYTDAI